MKTIIHVNQHVIKSNRKSNERKPVLTVKTYKNNTYAHEVEIKGPCRVIYSPDKPLSCGAHVWISTESEVIPIILSGEECNLEGNGPEDCSDRESVSCEPRSHSHH